MRNERYDRIRQLVSSMPDPHREVVILRYFENLSRKEMAEVLELPESVVKSRLFEAFQQLKRCLGDKESSL